MSAIIRGGTSGLDANVDANKGLLVAENIPAHPAAGGYYTVCGGPAGIVAAALATDTVLMAMRFSASSTRKAYINKVRFHMSVATVGASAGVAGAIGLQRFTAATPSGGTSRTANEQNEPLTTATDMTSIQDLASALTVTSVVFGTEVSWTRIPLFTTGGGFEWIYEPFYPTVLAAGDGLALRTRVQMAATQTWVFAYTVHWYEGPAVS